VSCQQNANRAARAAARNGIPRLDSQAASVQAKRRNAAARLIRRLQDSSAYASVAEVRRAWPGASDEQREKLRRLAPTKTRLAVGQCAACPGVPAGACPGEAGRAGASPWDEAGYDGGERILDLRGIFQEGKDVGPDV
jgi:hypothetical protein